MARVRGLTNRLIEYGYVARFFDGEANFLFVDERADPQAWRKRDTPARDPYPRMPTKQVRADVTGRAPPCGAAGMRLT